MVIPITVILTFNPCFMLVYYAVVFFFFPTKSVAHPEYIIYTHPLFYFFVISTSVVSEYGYMEYIPTRYLHIFTSII